ncbi:MAG TPA: twin-arginine translocation signal domain-containing protein [Candidatus Dormibacteraeota bacterium]|nr:twin-arginine translocation signal domain-containing protein [Candidatus Dormibacteraeota bacterium]
MKDLRLSRREVLKGAGAVGVLGALGIPTTVFADSGDGGDDGDGRIRWDLISLVFPDINAGGSDIAAATADVHNPQTAYTSGSTLTLTGSGTFRPGQSRQVTGGGTWTTNNPVAPGSGKYRVTELVSWIQAPGTLAGNKLLVDHIGNLADTRAGLAVLRIKYSDRLDGILFLSCNLGSPASVVEGINASRGFVNFFAVKTGSTLFHVLGDGEEG